MIGLKSAKYLNKRDSEAISSLKSFKISEFLLWTKIISFLNLFC